MFGSGSVRNSPPLHRAARWGDLARVQELLSASTSARTSHDDDDVDGIDGIDGIDAPDGNGSTALMWAAQFGKDDVVRLLLERGADPTTRNRFGWSALEYASTSALAGNTLPLLFAAPGKDRLLEPHTFTAPYIQIYQTYYYKGAPTLIDYVLLLSINILSSFTTQFTYKTRRLPQLIRSYVCTKT